MRVVLVLGALMAACVSRAEDDLRTRYPIVFSHHWSGSAQTAFLGDVWEGGGFDAHGVAAALRARGAIVYEPDKTPFASHEERGRLLYRRCAGESLSEKLCEGADAVAVDGVELAMLDYCSDESKRHSEYLDFGDCIERIRLNIICHSQGCPDSRYMISAMTNRLSGRPMHEHVASWTSMAGANKGTALADRLLALMGERPPAEGGEVPRVLRLLGYRFGGVLTREVYDSIVALSREYMTETTDMGCDARVGDCAPSFNQLYPNHPDVYYQTYSGRIEWLHPCYAELRLLWGVLWLLEGPNDSYISVDSQRFTTAGSSRADPPTYVVDRGLVTGESTRWWVRHPGISHMGFSNNRVPGLGGADAACTRSGRDAQHYRFSRVGLYVEIVSDLKAMGF